MTQRPLSPHLQIYKPQISSVLSILHRITGMALSTAIIAIIIWLIAIAGGPDHYYTHQKFYHTILGKLMLTGWLGCFYYHFCNGIRHLAWDCGWGFDIPTVNRSGWTVIAITVSLLIFTIIALF